MLPYFLKRSCEFSLFWVLLSENINSHEYGANLLLELEHWVKRQVKFSCSLDLPHAQTICCSVVKTLNNSLTVLFDIACAVCQSIRLKACERDFTVSDSVLFILLLSNSSTVFTFCPISQWRLLLPNHKYKGTKRHAVGFINVSNELSCPNRLWFMICFADYYIFPLSLSSDWLI